MHALPPHRASAVDCARSNQVHLSDLTMLNSEERPQLGQALVLSCLCWPWVNVFASLGLNSPIDKGEGGVPSL
jgi:hypothetical protein